MIPGVKVAVKAMSKRALVEHGHVPYLHTEITVLMHVVLGSPFCVKYLGVFETNSSICVVTELLSGGVLFDVIRSLGGIPVKHARFYLAELVLALEKLHDGGYMHRDLKPENLMLSAAGHLKLIDFGVCGRITTGRERESKSREAKRRTFCGTAEYVSPECLYNQGYTQAVDLG
ncbi:hypothetical protein KIPB_013873, partial [Kipferlia bialata]|eukprot:g13873.t1